jgi:N-acetylglucosaminyl-diphospho-decaprenol L-rhamnosyltransferase
MTEQIAAPTASTDGTSPRNQDPGNALMGSPAITDGGAAPPDADLARVAVVIVSYNSSAVLEACLRSLPSKGIDLVHVVVADNASTDDSLAIAKSMADLPMLTVEMGRNAGYAAAINAGIEAMGPDAMGPGGLDAVMVLNPDCELRPDTLAILWRALDQPGRGIAVPKLINTDGSLQPSLRRTPTIRHAIAEALLGARAGRIGSLGELISDPQVYERPGPFSWATGAAMLVRAAAIRDIGAWDESFLLYSEETEFALRAADHDWRLWYEPAAVVGHSGGESRVNPHLAALNIVNKLALFRRRHNPVAAMIYYLVVLLGESVRALMGRRISQAAVAAMLRPVSRTRVLAG